MTALSDPIGDYCGWVTQSALPRWAKDGFDPTAGRFRERLDRSGAPHHAPSRAMVQARQIYVFADAARRGWLPEGGRLAEIAMASFLRDFAVEEADHLCFLFSIDAAGGCVSATRDAYAHAFALFSLAALYRLNGDQRLLALADKTIRFLDDHMTDKDHGGLFDALPAPATGKRQNPHMHLLEAFLFLHEAAPERGYLDRAAEIVTLFETRLFDRRHGALLEYFNDDWTRHADPVRATIWEPGHHFEWVWLLDQFARARGEPCAAIATGLYHHALRHGVTPAGLVVDEVDSRHLGILRPSTRIWPHTEAIKAAGSLHEMGDADAVATAEAMASRLQEHFLERPFAGGWVDHLAASGAPLVDYVPASSLYHLYLAATEASRVFQPIRASHSSNQAI